MDLPHFETYVKTFCKMFYLKNVLVFSYIHYYISVAKLFKYFFDNHLCFAIIPLYKVRPLTVVVSPAVVQYINVGFSIELYKKLCHFLKGYNYSNQDVDGKHMHL